MKFKNLLIIFIVFSLVLFFSSPASARILLGKDYYEALHYFINRAEDSITVAMYFIILDSEDETSPVNKLVNDLIVARKRGVEIKVILEDSKLKANRLAYQTLRKNNIPVYFDLPDRLLHIKGVIIDNKIIFLGSANWSRKAFEDNYEASYFDDSPEDARLFEKYIESIPVQKGDLFLPELSGADISVDFLLSPKSGRRLLKNQADKQFDLYLLLSKIRGETGKDRLVIDYDALAKEMNYTAPEELGKYRSAHDYYYERIHRTLKKLEKNKLIRYEKGIVNLKESPETSEKPIIIPDQYWDYGYPQRLSLRAKYMYLICLYEAAKSTRYPFWFRSQKDMSELYGISDTTISLGLLELEEKGIIEVTRDPPTPPDFADRKANIYRMLPLNPHESIEGIIYKGS